MARHLLYAALAVPSFSHEMLVELFRARGDLAPELLRGRVDLPLEHDHAEQRSIDLSQVTSTEYRADCVILLHDRDDVAVAGIVVEVQLHIDEGKLVTWPVYVTALRAKFDCPVVLLVVAPTPDVAAWARKPIPIGHPKFCLEPVVIGFEDMPRVVDPAAAHRLPELAVLSVIAHADLDVATTAIEAIAELPEDQARLYLDVIMAALPPATRKMLESHMQGYVYQSEFARKYYSEGLEEGRERGLVEGQERGHEAGLQAAVLALLHAKLDSVTADDEAVIAGLRDEHRLTALIGVIGRATTAVEIRAALAAVRGQLIP